MPHGNPFKSVDELDEMTSAPNNFDADCDDRHWGQVLSNAIEATGLTDESLAKRTWGEVSPVRIRALRNGEVHPLPRWHEMSRLLVICDISPAAIGQGIEKDEIITIPRSRRAPFRKS